MCKVLLKMFKTFSEVRATKKDGTFTLFRSHRRGEPIKSYDAKTGFLRTIDPEDQREYQNKGMHPKLLGWSTSLTTAVGQNRASKDHYIVVMHVPKDHENLVLRNIHNPDYVEYNTSGIVPDSMIAGAIAMEDAVKMKKVIGGESLEGLD